MVDTARQANVQALRALFAQKEKIVIDALKAPKDLSKEDNDPSTPDPQPLDELCLRQNGVHHPADSSSEASSSNRQSLSAGSSHSSSPVLSAKPTVKPKPILHSKTEPERSISPTNIKNLVAHLEKADGMYSSRNQTPSPNTLSAQDSGKISPNICDTVNNNIASGSNIIRKPSPLLGATQSVLVKKETILISPDGRSDSQNVYRKQNSVEKNTRTLKIPFEIEQTSIIKSSLAKVRSHPIFGKISYRKKLLPSREVLGPPPKKPYRPSKVTLAVAPPLPQRNETQNKENDIKVNGMVLVTEAPPPLPDRTLNNRQSIVPPPRPSVPLPVVVRSPPNRPVPVLPTKPNLDCSEELYGDTVEPERVQSLIAEYTEEEECGQRRNSQNVGLPPFHPPPTRPKNPPPPPPGNNNTPNFEIPTNNLNQASEEYKQDNQDIEDEIYEVMPAEENRGPVYSNSKEQEKRGREEQKRIKREQKEKEKHEKLCEKLRKKYGLTGEEIPVDAGVVKMDSKGSKTDLTVHKGETVLILRMENNPVGKWLAKNEKGKIGYVELTNIEVDADSVKSVMTVRVSQAIEEAIYSDIQTEEIYECPY